jgi:putative transposase
MGLIIPVTVPGTVPGTVPSGTVPTKHQQPPNNHLHPKKETQMPRTARLTDPGRPHHITQRGNYQQKIFDSEADYRFYLNHISKYSLEHKLSIIAYCLMPNHVHFIATPLSEDSLVKTFAVTNMRYSQYFNKKHNTKGHLWQGRFFSCPLQERHLFAAMRYVENNPVRCKLVNNAEDWPWSSAKSHVFKTPDYLLLTYMTDILSIPNWKTYLSEPENNMIISKIRKT